jgi:hypothetical protein
MPINIDEPIILADSQKIIFDTLQITRDEQGVLSAIIIFMVRNQNGMRLDNKTITIKPDQWNHFWTNFTSGSFVYAKVLALLGIETPPDASVELDFINS